MINQAVLPEIGDNLISSEREGQMRRVLGAVVLSHSSESETGIAQIVQRVEQR